MAFYEKKGLKINDEKNAYFNESLSDLVRNINVKERLIEYNGKLIQQVNPIFQESTPDSYRTAFFVPEKNFFGLTISTFIFDLLVVWLMTLCCYVALYFEWMKKLVQFFGNVNFSNKITIPFRKK